MAEASDTWGILYQNLIDAGCGEKLVLECMSLARAGRRTELLRLLSEHRENLLCIVHENQKRIDCLDFLVYRISKG